MARLIWMATQDMRGHTVHKVFGFSRYTLIYRIRRCVELTVFLRRTLEAFRPSKASSLFQITLPNIRVPAGVRQLLPLAILSLPRGDSSPLLVTPKLEMLFSAVRTRVGARVVVDQQTPSTSAQA